MCRPSARCNVVSETREAGQLGAAERAGETEKQQQTVPAFPDLRGQPIDLRGLPNLGQDHPKILDQAAVPAASAE